MSADQTDLPSVSQSMPLTNMQPLYLHEQPPEGLVLTRAQLAELRKLKDRARRASDDVAEFWQRLIPGSRRNR